MLVSGCGQDEDASIAESTVARQTIESDPGTPRQAARPHPIANRSPLGYLRRQQGSSARNEPLTDAARELLPTDAEVWCWDKRIWSRAVQLANRVTRRRYDVYFAGIADLYAFEIHLDGWVCRELENVGRRADGERELALADALNVFVHETRHLSQTGSNEATTTCTALQRIPAATKALGASEQRGKELAHIFWEEIYSTLPAEYRSDKCLPGGELDEDPGDPDFP